MAAGREPGGHGGKGRSNQQAVLREILLSGPVSRIEIASRVGLTPGSVSRIARRLIDAGLVRELAGTGSEAASGPGRRIVPLDIDPQGGQVLGINIGLAFQSVTLADIKGSVIARSELQLETVEDPELVVRSVARESRRLVGTHLDGRNRLLGGLLMVAGQVDPVRGDVVDAPYLGWGRFPLRARLTELIDLPIKVRSVTAGVARESMLFGEARGRDNVLILLCGLGIGAAVILDGRLVEGDNPYGGGIGRIEVVGEDGAAAPLDHIAGGLGILQRIHGKELKPGRTPLPEITRALVAAVERDREGDPDIAVLMARAGRVLGRVVVQFGHFVRVETVRIAGPLAVSPRYVSAVGEAVNEGMGQYPTDVAASGATGMSGSRMVSSGLAICEFLLERPLDLARLRGPQT